MNINSIQISSVCNHHADVGFYLKRLKKKVQGLQFITLQHN